MEHRAFDNTVVVRLDKGDDIATCLLDVASQRHIALADISGIGATDCFTAGVFDLSCGAYRQTTYTGNHEINSLVGSLTTKDGKPYLHLHITCTDLTGKVVGGHLLSGTISLTAEIFMHVASGGVDRAFDSDLGINRIKFE